MVNVCVLGTQGGMPMVGKFMSAVIINYGGRKILIDCGEGTQIAMRKYNCGFKTLDYILISHSHGDHTIGISGLLGTMGNSGRLEPVTIIGPKGISEIVKGLMVINKHLPYEIRVIEAGNDSFDIYEGVTVNTLEVEHSTECIAFSLNFKRRPKFSLESAEKNNVPKKLWSLLQKGKEIEYEGKTYTPDLVLGEERRGIKLSYLTDTRPLEKITEFIRDSELFICEGNYGNDDDIDKAIKNKHMTFREAATLAKSGNCKAMIITHFSPSMENPSIYEKNAKEVFENSVIGYDGIERVLTYEEEN